MKFNGPLHSARGAASSRRLHKTLAALPATLLACLLLLVLPRCLHAQTATGTITGRVTDSSGAVLPGTVVSLTRTDTGLVLQTTTNGDGIYSFPSLQTGPFLVEISHFGFKAARATLTLSVAQTAQVDLILQVGSETESVTVQSDSSIQLDTQESNLSYTVGARQVAELPLNGHNPYGLAALAPGIMPGNFASGAFHLSRSFELGNIPRSAAALRSPLTFQDNLSAIKDFPIRDPLTMQFRLEAFNFLNRVQFGFPTRSSTRQPSAQSPRRLICQETSRLL